MKILIALLLICGVVQAQHWYRLRQEYPRIVKNIVDNNNGRIVGGNQATLGQFPYQVALILDGTDFCSGTLITDNMVLTSASCTLSSASQEIHAGVQNFYNGHEPGRVRVVTSNHLTHKDFDYFTLEHNIALISLGQSISGPNIAPIRLPSRSMAGEVLEGKTARISGWGYTSLSVAEISDELRYVDLTIISKDECRLGSDSSDCQFCTDTAGGTVGYCNGDLGGPLTITEDDGNVTQVGIISSYSYSNCDLNFPQIYVRLACYLDWLETYVPGLSILP